MTHKTLWLIGLSSLLLAACGGGGGDASAPAPVAPQPATPPTDREPTQSVFVDDDGLFIHGDEQSQAGQSIGFVVVTDDSSEITSVSWQQLTGPETLTILASHTQAIGFDAMEAGSYSMRVSATLINGERRQTEFDFSVQQDTTRANIRLDHMVPENGRVSLRVDTPDNAEIARVTWRQIEGTQPAELILGADDRSRETAQVRPNSLFFTAPLVQIDEVLVFEALVEFQDGTTATDRAHVLVDNIAFDESAYFPSNNLYVSTHMQPYSQDSEYASAMLECVYNNTISRSCSFDRLPLIGMVTQTPTIQDILDRTLVSHPWMGARFEEYLRDSVAGQDMLNLLRGATAIVISYDIRPSFYWSATGAIYLDANNLWRTPEERDTLNTAPDFRSDFGVDLQFDVFWRYVSNGQSYLRQAFPSISTRTDKSFEALEAGLSWLMYHELGHANDFFPPSRWRSIPRNTSPLVYSNDNAPDSTSFATIFPLRSSEMEELADVRFGGTTANITQREYTPDDVAGFFSPDVAPAFYSYYTIREDYATLFERFMMLYRYGIPADTGILDLDDGKVAFAQRGRINTPEINSRLQYAVERLYPELNFSQIQPSLPEPITFPDGLSWSEILVFGTNEAAKPDSSYRLPPGLRMQNDHPQGIKPLQQR